MYLQQGEAKADSMKSLAMQKNLGVVVGVLAPWIAAAFAIFYIYRDEAMAASARLVFTVLALVGAVVIFYGVCALNFIFWKVSYNDRTLIYRSIFGRRISADYSDITRVVRTGGVLYLYVQNKRMTVYLETNGIDDFLEALSRHAIIPEG